MFTKSSQKISTQHLTVLINGAITQSEQRRGTKGEQEMSSMSSQNIPVPKKQGNSMSVSAEGRYEVEKER